MKVLIADHIPEILELSSLILLSQFEAEVVSANSGLEAIHKLEQEGSPSPEFDLVISSYDLPDHNGGEVFRALRKKYPQTPFMLVSPKPYSHMEEFASDANFESLKQPFEEEMFIGKIQLLTVQAKARVWASGYIPVDLAILERVTSVGVPLFIQLSESHFVKLTHADHLFTADDIERMKRKGAQELCIEIEKFNYFLSRFRKNVFSQVLWRSANTAQSMKMLSQSWDFILKSARSFGCSSEIVELVKQNIAKVLAIISAEVDFQDVYRGFKDSAGSRLSSHCYLVAILATAIAKELGCASEITLQQLTFAALLHDMDLDEEQFTTKQTLLNSVDLKDFAGQAEMQRILEHPQTTARRMLAWAGCPSGVEEIISQHHEKPDGEGFPHGLKADQIGALPALFILAEDVIYHCVDNFMVRPVDYLKMKAGDYREGEFSKIYAAAEKVLDK